MADIREETWTNKNQKRKLNHDIPREIKVKEEKENKLFLFSN